MAGSFRMRMDELMAEVGSGKIRGTVVVDQVYAHIQHEALDFKHPRGGQAKYLEGPMLERASIYSQKLADGALEPGGLERAMIEVVEDLSEQVATHAPVEHGYLRGSAAPSVTDDGVSVYSRAPRVPRLSEAQLKELS